MDSLYRPTTHSTRLAYLHFGSARVLGTAVSAFGMYPHVVLFKLDRNLWQRCCSWLLQKMPSPIQRLAQRLWPISFLPDTVVVKTLKPELDEEFENEKEIYATLKTLQGHTIPHFYGEARFEERRALVLSYVDGILPNKQHLRPPIMPPREFQRRLEEACRALIVLGVDYDDVKLDNVMLVGDRLVFLDMELASLRLADLEWSLEINVSHFMHEYRRYVKHIEDYAEEDGIKYKAPPELLAATEENRLEWVARTTRRHKEDALWLAMQPKQPPTHLDDDIPVDD